MKQTHYRNQPFYRNQHFSQVDMAVALVKKSKVAEKVSRHWEKVRQDSGKHDRAKKRIDSASKRRERLKGIWQWTIVVWVQNWGTRRPKKWGNVPRRVKTRIGYGHYACCEHHIFGRKADFLNINVYLQKYFYIYPVSTMLSSWITQIIRGLCQFYQQNALLWTLHNFSDKKILPPKMTCFLFTT